MQEGLEREQLRLTKKLAILSSLMDQELERRAGEGPKTYFGPLQPSLCGRDASNAAKGKPGSTKELRDKCKIRESILRFLHWIDLPTLFLENKLWEGCE